jgi:oxygen-independent coproporphyrinogen-3 oxidase
VANNTLYTKSILQEAKLDYEEEILTTYEHLNEYIMTSLRTMWGCDLAHITTLCDATTADTVERSSHLFQEKKWMIQQDKKLLLTPKGKLYADRIASELFVVGQ